MNTNFLNSVTNFIKKRTFEFIGLILISTSIALAIAFTTYSPEDPSFIYGDRDFEIKNFFGIYGSSVADFLLQSFGLVSFLILANFLFWGINLIIKKEIKRIILKLFFVVAYLVLGTIFIYITIWCMVSITFNIIIKVIRNIFHDIMNDFIIKLINPLSILQII